MNYEDTLSILRWRMFSIQLFRLVSKFREKKKPLHNGSVWNPSTNTMNEFLIEYDCKRLIENFINSIEISLLVLRQCLETFRVHSSSQIHWYSDLIRPNILCIFCNNHIARVWFQWLNWLSHVYLTVLCACKIKLKFYPIWSIVIF